MKKIILSFVCLILLGSNSGCSVFMAANQPDQKDVDLLKPGTKREVVIAEFGNPISSETNEQGQLEEIYKFTQGIGTGEKVGRAFFHGAADFFTVGLWEIVGTPIEGVNDGQILAFKITYDKDKTIVNVAPLNEDAEGEMESAKNPKKDTDCDPGMESCI